MNYEVEQKFALDSPQVLEQVESVLETSLAAPVLQVDRYFNHPSRDFGQTDEAFRLRSVGDRNWVTYKGPRIDVVTKTRREVELPLPDGEDVLEGYARLWIELGFREVGRVRKHRRRASFQWQQRQGELVHDVVDGLGEFVELEMISSADDLEEVQATLAALSAELGLRYSERRSYLELLLTQS